MEAKPSALAVPATPVCAPLLTPSAPLDPEGASCPTSCSIRATCSAESATPVEAPGTAAAATTPPSALLAASGSAAVAQMPIEISGIGSKNSSSSSASESGRRLGRSASGALDSPRVATSAWQCEESLKKVLRASSLSLLAPTAASSMTVGRTCSCWFASWPRGIGASSVCVALDEGSTPTAASAVVCSEAVSVKPLCIAVAMLRSVRAAATSAMANCKRCLGWGPVPSMNVACMSPIATPS
mmetsp:Transcript_66744/g.186072  ORF Transcript_66744/g.186072 Transcript_66744/m.186072 type:complete len:242 (+) Transcript_66744:471-1196(+)